MFLSIILINLFAGIFAKTLPDFQNRHEEAELTSQYWVDQARAELTKTLHQKVISHKAKNVIIFIGDGMGVSTITPSRILKGQLKNNSGEEEKLVFEDFPNACLIKTYNVDYQVPDSAGTATAYLCGVKSNKGVLGVTAKVKKGETNCKLVQENSVDSIFQLALRAGKSAGIVTTTIITDATPGAGYAHVSHRDWEGSIPSEAAQNPNGKECKDIARQLVENEPGKSLNVIMGGGARFLYPKNYTNPITQRPGEREDGRNLVEKWVKYRKETGLEQERYKFVNNRAQLLEANKNQNLDYLFGIFQDEDLSNDKERDPNLEPSLEEMTESAINILKKNDQGFVLLVEGGNIDNNHHVNQANLALYEAVAFDKAIERALTLVSTEDTLIVVTADHSHTLTMNGYPKRGNSIMGIAEKEDETNKPYTTLMYGNGPGYKKDRVDPSTIDTSSLKYQSYSGVFLEESNHGGEDVALFSIGPMSHLFRGAKEQSYIANVMEFSACLGVYAESDHCKTTKSSSFKTSPKISSIYLLLFINISIVFIKIFNL